MTFARASLRERGYAYSFDYNITQQEEIYVVHMYYEYPGTICMYVCMYRRYVKVRINRLRKW